MKQKCPKTITSVCCLESNTPALCKEISYLASFLCLPVLVSLSIFTEAESARVLFCFPPVVVRHVWIHSAVIMDRDKYR